MDKKSQKILVATNSQKVLNFFLDHPGEEFVEKEVQKITKLSKSGTNYALRELVRANFLSRYKKGKMHLYSMNYKNPLVKQLKVLKTIVQIQPLLKRLERLSSRVILFGSSSRGEDIADSDVDLFVVTHNKEGIEETVKNFKSKRNIQAIIRTELKYTEMKQTDPVFYDQVSKGIVLWEAEIEP